MSDYLSTAHLPTLIRYLDTSTGIIAVRYSPAHSILGANRHFFTQMPTGTTVLGESINSVLSDPDGRDCGLLATDASDLPISFTAKLRSNDHTYRCHLFATEEGFLLFGERLSNTETETIERMSLMTNELAILTIELRKRNAALEQANETIRELTRIDPLTNLANRRHFAEVLDIAMAVARRHRQPLSLISLDLDRFKTVNDTYGHDMGDLVLKGIAGLLRDSCRTEDLPVRLGGEEFLILTPNTAVDEAYTLAERLRIRVAEAPLLPKGAKLTASFGVSQLLPQDSYFAFMKRADMALYEAKSGGRNKTVVRMSNDPTS